MVTQVAADAGPGDRDLDSQRAQRGRWADPGAQQHRRRLDGARRHGHATRADEGAFAFPKDAHAIGAAAIHDKALDMRAGPDREIAAPACRLIQIGRCA